MESMNDLAVPLSDIIADQNAVSVNADEKNYNDDDNRFHLPMIETLDDILNKSEQIIEWCNNNSIQDHVYEFKRNCIMDKDHDNRINMFDIPNAYIAGSYPLRHLLDILFSKSRVRQKGILSTEFKWNGNDVDIFIINREHPARNKLGKGLDIVANPEKSIQELLIGFDLPVCRVGLDFKGTFYISIQAMYSILTRKMNLPAYLRDKRTAYLVMKSHCFQYYHESNDNKYSFPEFLIDRFYERIKKYSGRGFGVNWIETHEIIQWIKTRSAYAASVVMK